MQQHVRPMRRLSVAEGAFVPLCQRHQVSATGPVVQTASDTASGAVGRRHRRGPARGGSRVRLSPSL